MYFVSLFPGRLHFTTGHHPGRPLLAVQSSGFFLKKKNFSPARVKIFTDPH